MFQTSDNAPQGGYVPQNESWLPPQPLGGQNYEPAPQEEVFIPAAVFERAVALFIDLFLFITLFSVIFYILGGLFGARALNILYALFFNGAFILYCSFFGSQGRKTLGKFLLGINAVDNKTGQALTLKQAFIRTLGYYLGFFTLFGGFALAFFNKKRRALEDILSGSRVIETREKSDQESIIIAVLGTVLISAVFIYLYFVAKSVTGAADAAMVTAAQRQVNQIAYLEEQHKKAYGFYTEDLVRLGLISGDAVQFQRDVQKNLKRRGFAVGVTPRGYKISGHAKDLNQTPVFAEK